MKKKVFNLLIFACTHWVPDTRKKIRFQSQDAKELADRDTGTEESNTSKNERNLGVKTFKG